MSDEKTLDVLRGEVDMVDHDLLLVLAERFGLTRQVGVLKAKLGLDPVDAVRERAMYERLRESAVKEDVEPDAAEQWWRTIISAAVVEHRRIAAGERVGNVEELEAFDGSPDLAALRGHLDTVDDRLMRLLGRRFGLSHKIGLLKRQQGLSPVDVVRENALYDRIRAQAVALQIDPDTVEHLWRSLLSIVVTEHRHAGDAPVYPDTLRVTPAKRPSGL